MPRPTLLASSHKGWITTPPSQLPTNSMARRAVFPEKDRLLIGNSGWSLIYGSEAMFLQLDDPHQIITQPKPGTETCCSNTNKRSEFHFYITSKCEAHSPYRKPMDYSSSIGVSVRGAPRFSDTTISSA